MAFTSPPANVPVFGSATFNNDVLAQLSYLQTLVPELQNFIATNAGNQTIVGTVSQSGGMPTGALFQRGSNPNGRFLRMADGTQICTHLLNFDTGDDPTGIKQYPYPAAFVGLPDHVDAAIRYTIGGPDEAARRELANTLPSSVTSHSTSGWEFRTSYAGADVGDLPFTLYALGRWY